MSRLRVGLLVVRSPELYRRMDGAKPRIPSLTRSREPPTCIRTATVLRAGRIPKEHGRALGATRTEGVMAPPLFSESYRAPRLTGRAAHSSAPAVHLLTRRFFLTLRLCGCQQETTSKGCGAVREPHPILVI